MNPFPSLEQLFYAILYYRFILGVIQIGCYYAYPRRETLTAAAISSTDERDTLSVAVVCATVDDGSKLRHALQTWLLGRPSEVWIVTNSSSYEKIMSSLSDIKTENVHVVKSPRTNKRAQLCEGFRRTSSDVVIIADDDTYWTSNVVSRLTAPFALRLELGAVFPEVKFRPAGLKFNIWETLSASRLAGDCIDIRTSITIDGGVFCASGTTAAYRGRILRDHTFSDRFQNETWMGRPLNAGDDQSLTLWLCEHDWRCHVIPDEGRVGFCVLTTPRTTWNHLGQLARWARSDWQACLRGTLMTKSLWR